MAKRVKSRLRTKIEEIDDGESVMVEAKYFDDLSQPEHLRYSSLLGKKLCGRESETFNFKSYLIVFEDGGRSLIAKTKVRRVEPSLEDTEDTSSDKNDKISFQIVKNVNTAVITNSVFQSTITSSENCITVSSSNQNSDVQPATTSTEISISSVSDVSNHLSMPKPDVILQTDYVTDKPGPTNIDTPDSVSVPSPDTLNIVLYDSTITPVEKPEALDKWAVTTRQQRKNNAPDSAKQIRDKKLKKSPVYEDEFFLLSDALQECDDISDDEIDVVLLPPENVDGDTDNECRNDTGLTYIYVGLVK